MPLIADYTGIKDYNDVVRTKDGQENPKTVNIVFAMMPIGMSSITEKNIKEVATRMSMFGYLDKSMTMDDLRAHIGLKVNVTDMTAAGFNKHFANIKRRDHAYAVSKM